MASTMCCMHPRIDSPEPPSRPRVSSIGDIFAHAALAEDHPDSIHIPRAGSVDPNIIRSPKIADKLRMKFSRSSLKKSLSHAHFDGDAQAMTSQEVVRQVDGAFEMQDIEPHVAKPADKVSDTTASDESQLTNRHPIPNGCTLAPGQNMGSRSFSELFRTRSCPGLKQEPNVNAVQVIAAASRRDQRTIDLLDTYAGSSAATSVPSQDSVKFSLHDPCLQNSDAVSLMKPCMRARGKSSTVLGLNDLLLNRRLRAIAATADNDSEVVDLDSKPEELPVMPDFADSATAVESKLAPDVSSMTDAAQDLTLASIRPCLHEMNISNQLRSLSNVSLPVTHDTLATAAPAWHFHHREIPAGDSESCWGTDQHDRIVSCPLGMEYKNVPSAWGPMCLPILDASSSIYSRSYSAEHQRDIRSPCDLAGVLNASLAEWPLRMDGAFDEPEELEKPEQPVQQVRAVSASQVQPKSCTHDDTGTSRVDCASEIPDAVKASCKLSKSSPDSTASSRAQSIPSKSSLGTFSKNSKRSRFIEAFTPPIKIVKKRRSYFRFLRPGSRKQVRSVSTPMLRNTTLGQEEYHDGNVDEFLTVQYDISNVVAAQNRQKRSMTEGNLHASMSATTQIDCPEAEAECTTFAWKPSLVTKSTGLGASDLLAVPEQREVAKSVGECNLKARGSVSLSIPGPRQKIDRSKSDAGSRRDVSTTHLAVQEQANRKSSFNSGSVQQQSGSERRPTLADYERSLSVSGDDRRRPSTMSIPKLLDVEADDRKASISIRRQLSSARALGRQDGDGNPLMANALRRHQQEKALFRSASKQYESLIQNDESLLLESDSPLFTSLQEQNSAEWKESEPDVTISANDTCKTARLRSEFPFKRGSRESRRLSAVNTQATIDVSSSDPEILTHSPRARIGLPHGSTGKAKSGFPPVSWSRFASHTRNERCGSAGLADSVLIRDFATEQQKHDSSDLTSFDDPDANRHLAKQDIKKVTRSSLIKSRSFGSIARYYHALFTSDSEFTGKNRRTSVTISGKLKHPELEMLPPPSVIEHHSGSFHKHLKQIEEQVMGDIDDILHHTSDPNHHAQHPEQQERSSVHSNIEFRHGSLFTSASSRGFREDSVCDPNAGEGLENSTVEQSPPGQSPTESGSPASLAVKRDSVVIRVPAFPILDGVDETEHHRITTEDEKERPSFRAEAWSQMYKNCLARQVPRLSISDDYSALRTVVETPPTLKQVKARSPEQIQKLDPNVCIRRFPSVTVVDDRKGHLRSVSLISAQSLKSTKQAGANGIQRTSTYDLISFLQAKEQEEREKLLGIVGGSSHGLAA